MAMIVHNKPTIDSVPGFWDIQDTPVITPGDLNNIEVFHLNNNNDILIVNDLLDIATCGRLTNIFKASNILAPVSVNGLKDEVCGIGSKRATGWSEYIANELSKIIIPMLGILGCNRYTSTDWNLGGSMVYKPIMISPMLRFMKYQQVSEH